MDDFQLGSRAEDGLMKIGVNVEILHGGSVENDGNDWSCHRVGDLSTIHLRLERG